MEAEFARASLERERYGLPLEEAQRKLLLYDIVKKQQVDALNDHITALVNQRNEELDLLAGLWPADELFPSVLKPFRTAPEEDVPVDEVSLSRCLFVICFRASRASNI